MSSQYQFQPSKFLPFFRKGDSLTSSASERPNSLIFLKEKLVTTHAIGSNQVFQREICVPVEQENLLRFSYFEWIAAEPVDPVVVNRHASPAPVFDKIRPRVLIPEHA